MSGLEGKLEWNMVVPEEEALNLFSLKRFLSLIVELSLPIFEIFGEILHRIEQKARFPRNISVSNPGVSHVTRPIKSVFVIVCHFSHFLLRIVGFSYRGPRSIHPLSKSHWNSHSASLTEFLSIGTTANWLTAFGDYRLDVWHQKEQNHSHCDAQVQISHRFHLGENLKQKIFRNYLKIYWCKQIMKR